MISVVNEFDKRVSIAAFLTQTVQLDDATTVKLEIWYVSWCCQPPTQVLNCVSRDTAGQERYKVGLI